MTYDKATKTKVRHEPEIEIRSFLNVDIFIDISRLCMCSRIMDEFECNLVRRMGEEGPSQGLVSSKLISD